jgi:hypothetical protein
VDNAGQIVANGNLSIAAPLVVGRAVYVPDIVGRPAGLYNAFSGPTALLSTVPTGGAFLAPAGTVSIDSPGPVLLAGGQIEGQVATHVPGGIDRREPAQAVRVGRQRPIGLFRPWLTQIP